MGKIILPIEGSFVFRGREEDVSDGYHSFKELYEHRAALFIALANTIENLTGIISCAWKSRLHQDGTMYDGFFIAGISLPTFDPPGPSDPFAITYHLENKYWDLLHIPERDNAPEWDGHTPQDVVDRLLEWSTGG